MKDLVRAILLLAFASLLGACGGGDSATAAPAPAGVPPAAVAAVCELDTSLWDESVWL